jgi:hypothetical protein
MGKAQFGNGHIWRNSLMLFRLISNIWPSYAEFSSEDEMRAFLANRPDLVASPYEGENENHIYRKLRWKVWR